MQSTIERMHGAEIMAINIESTVMAVDNFGFDAFIIMYILTAMSAIAVIYCKYFLTFLICDHVYIVTFYFIYPKTKVRSEPNR